MNLIRLLINQKDTIGFSLACLLAFIFVCCITGLIPFTTAPTFGQAVWATGFAHSLANESFFSIYATNFGIPNPAPISFGLPAIIPMSWFIRLGIHAIDAYNASFILFYIAAFWGAYRLTRLYQVEKYTSLLICALWFTFPIVLRHHSYSMLGLGIALIPFYMYIFHIFTGRLNNHHNQKYYSRLLICLIYTAICILSIFMDGYSFMMFSVASTFLLATSILRKKDTNLFAIFWHGFSLLAAYLLYNQFIGSYTFHISPIDFFRGWGLDLSFLVIPTQNTHWIWDMLGLSTTRSAEQFFGDSSTWRMTFLLPLLIASGYVVIKNKKNIMVKIYIILFLLSMYLALGPSLKIFSTKPPGWETANRLMPAEAAVMSTKNAFLYNNLPGFKNMRATYRWSALSTFALWMILVIALGNKKTISRSQVAMISLLIILFLPNIPVDIRIGSDRYNKFHQLDSELIATTEPIVSKGETIVFLPHRNDFVVNYIAGKLDLQTYNIGGDKNVEMAQTHWPEVLQRLPADTWGTELETAIHALLATHTADKVILPYFHTLAGGQWTDEFKFMYKKDVMAFLTQLKDKEQYEIKEYEYFVMVRLR